jgi:hypothetical protein
LYTIPINLNECSISFGSVERSSELTAGVGYREVLRAVPLHSMPNDENKHARGFSNNETSEEWSQEDSDADTSSDLV